MPRARDGAPFIFVVGPEAPFVDREALFPPLPYLRLDLLEDPAKRPRDAPYDSSKPPSAHEISQLNDAVTSVIGRIPKFGDNIIPFSSSSVASSTSPASRQSQWSRSEWSGSGENENGNEMDEDNASIASSPFSNYSPPSNQFQPRPLDISKRSGRRSSSSSDDESDNEEDDNNKSRRDKKHRHRHRHHKPSSSKKKSSSSSSKHHSKRFSLRSGRGGDSDSNSDSNDDNNNNTLHRHNHSSSSHKHKSKQFSFGGGDGGSELLSRPNSSGLNAFGGIDSSNQYQLDTLRQRWRLLKFKDPDCLPDFNAKLPFSKLNEMYDEASYQYNTTKGIIRYRRITVCIVMAMEFGYTKVTQTEDAVGFLNFFSETIDDYDEMLIEMCDEKSAVNELISSIPMPIQFFGMLVGSFALFVLINKYTESKMLSRAARQMLFSRDGLISPAHTSDRVSRYKTFQARRAQEMNDVPPQPTSYPPTGNSYSHSQGGYARGYNDDDDLNYENDGNVPYNDNNDDDEMDGDDRNHYNETTDEHKKNTSSPKTPANVRVMRDP